MKIGAAPFHFWLPIVIQGINWINNYLLLTWQKLGPLILIISSFRQNLTSLFLILSIIVGAIGGFNQTSLKKLIAFSSINQVSWLISSIFIRKYLWTIYFIFYFFITLNVIQIFNYFNLLYIPQLINTKINPINLLFFFLESYQ